MSLRLQVSMALFDCEKFAFVHDLGASPADQLVGAFPASPPSLASLHWAFDPAFGLPEEPHIISVLNQEAGGVPAAHEIADLFLNSSNGFRVSFVNVVEPEEGAICITAWIEASAGTEIYATDLLGEEVPGTRQSTSVQGGTAFLGPHIFGLQATNAVTLQNVTIFSIPPNFNGGLTPVARVAPNFASVQAYQQQRYLAESLNAADALKQRLLADSIARRNTKPPKDLEFEKRIHRRDPFLFVQSLMASDFHRLTEKHFDALMANPGLEIPFQLPDSDQKTLLRLASLWQYLACSGPLESITLGQAVTLPLDDPQLVPASGADLFKRVQTDSKLPFPLICVESRFGTAAPLRHLRSWARLALPLTEMGLAVAPMSTQPPAYIDGPAMTDLELRLTASRAHAGHFIAHRRKDQAGRVYEREEAPQDDVTEPPPPRLFLFSDEDNDHSDSGAPMMRLGPVDLPMTGQEEIEVFVQPRDVFGRWPPETAASGLLSPWPVSSPALLSSRIDYRGDGIAWLSLMLGWDWTLRRPAQIRVRLQTGHEDVPGPLEIRFDGESGPELALNSPPGVRIEAVAELPNPDPDVAIGPPLKAGDFRAYLLTAPLGRFASLFNDSATTGLRISAAAREQVSGDRTSPVTERRETLSDPRPPVIMEEPWRLLWTARANGAGIATARIPRPQIAGGDNRVAGFNLWRAGETAVLDLAIAARYGDTEEAAARMEMIRAERKKPLRLQLIRGLVSSLLPDPDFRRNFVNLFAAADTHTRAEDMELDLPARLDGFEFAMYSALSQTGIQSDKTQIKSLVAIAVPQPRPPARPDLRLITDDPNGLLALGGHWLALVGTDKGVDPRDIRIFMDEAVFGDEGELVSDPEDLLHPLTRITVLSAEKVARYLPEPEAITALLGRDHVHYLLLSPPEGWRALAIAADIVSDPAGVPEEYAISLRSAPATGILPPMTGPRLDLLAGGPGDAHRVIGQSGLFVAQVPGFAACDIYFEIASDTPNMPLRFGPVPLASFATDGGVEILADMTARYVDEEKAFHLIWAGDAPAPGVRMICSDPAGRATWITV